MQSTVNDSPWLTASAEIFISIVASSSAAMTTREKDERASYPQLGELLVFVQKMYLFSPTVYFNPPFAPHGYSKVML